MECERIFSVGWFGWCFFFSKIVKLRLVCSFFRSFRFWFWMILDEFNLMIEKLKRRTLLGINIASGTILHFAKTPLWWNRWDFPCRNRGFTTIHTWPGGFARRTPLWIWTLDLEKPWLLWWAPWWWNSSHIASWNFCCWLPVGIFNVIKRFERITGIIKWDPFGMGQAWWSFWRGPFALVPSLGWQYNDSTPVLTKVLITSSSGSGIRKSCFASKTQTPFPFNWLQWLHSGVNKHGWMEHPPFW